MFWIGEGAGQIKEQEARQEQEATELTEKTCSSAYPRNVKSFCFQTLEPPLLSTVHRLFSKAQQLTQTIIAAAIEVHRDKGPGLIESVYEWCLLMELGLRNLNCANQKAVVIAYKGFTRDEHLRFDVLVENCVLVEVKAVENVLPVHKAQVLSYMKLLDVPIGLLINFHETKLTNGVSRLILPAANLT